MRLILHIVVIINGIFSIFLLLFAVIKINTAQLALILNLNQQGLSHKAKRQLWPYNSKNLGRGKPQHDYPLATLPSDIQIAWANWDQAAYDAAKVDGVLEVDMLPPVTVVEAKEALEYPIRGKYYIDKKEVEGATKQWNGTSTGFCIEGRMALLTRFPELIEGQSKTPAPPGSTFPSIKLTELKPARICPKCDYGVFQDESDQKYCKFDGYKLISVCPKCGEPIEHPGTNFCGNCGEQLRKVIRYE